MMKISCIQLASAQGETHQDRMRKAEACLEKIAEEKERPVQIIFPEIWATGFFDFDHYYGESEADRGAVYELMSSWARKLGCYIHTGSFVEKDGDKYYNCSLLLDPNGKMIGKYRKIHLFSFKSREPELLSGGTNLCVVDTEYGRVGLSTCYDLRFPELYRLMMKMGVEYFLVCSAWGLARLEHWRLFNQARAVENQCFMASCDGVGTLGGVSLAGHSMITDPWGVIAAEAGLEEEILSAEIDPGLIIDNRNNFSALRDKRFI